MIQPGGGLDRKCSETDRNVTTLEASIDSAALMKSLTNSQKKEEHLKDTLLT